MDKEEQDRIANELRLMLSVSQCTKETLIESVVHRQIELERSAIAFRKLREEHARILGAIQFLESMMSERASNPERLANAAEKYFDSPEIASLARAISKAIQRSNGRRSQKRKMDEDRDGKQTAIRAVRTKWLEWQAHSDPKSVYGTQMDFAESAVKTIRKHPNGDPILSVDHIVKNLIRKWKKEDMGQGSAKK